MKVHHVNCGTMCPLARRWVNGDGGLFERGAMVAHVLIVEAPHGLVLVDTGLGTGDVADPGRLGPFNLFASPTLSREETALARVQALGHDAGDVRDIVLTHLDLDHAGGLGDFPRARVHVFRPEHAAAMARASRNERARYLPAQWAHGPSWSLHEPDGERFFGLESVRAVPETNDDVLIVPLVGHTRGHSGVAVRGERGWLLHAGDSYFHRDEIHRTPAGCPVGLRLFQAAAAVDDGNRRHNQARLRELRASAPEVRVFSAHDPVELDELTSPEQK
ncbi:MAG: MBL fold metallo-hydrolase [Polyangiaceae bacterium]|nr:MBL fold metallo-hydrolase [Polyangiaceae bacterium]